MKIYVDELPKSCAECPMCKYSLMSKIEECCLPLNPFFTLDENEIREKFCPLQSLAEHDKEVCKQKDEQIIQLKEDLQKALKLIDEGVELNKLNEKALEFNLVKKIFDAKSDNERLEIIDNWINSILNQMQELEKESEDE